MTRKNKNKGAAPAKAKQFPTLAPKEAAPSTQGHQVGERNDNKKEAATTVEELTPTIPNEETGKRSTHSNEWPEHEEGPRLCVSCHLMEEMALEILSFHQLRIRTKEFCIDPEALAEYRRMCVEIGNCCGGGALRSYIRGHHESEGDDYYTTSSSSATGVFWKNKEPINNDKRDDDEKGNEARKVNPKEN